MIAAAFRLELRRDRGLLLWLAVTTIVYAGTMSLVFPTFRENTALIDQYMNLYPPEFMAAFGLEGSLADPGSFFSTYVGTFLWPVIAAIAGIVTATRPVAADLDRGFLELPLSTPLTRVQYLSVSIAGQVLVCVVLAIAAVGGVLAVGALVDARFDVGRFLMAIPVLVASACAVSAVASLVSVLTLSRGVAAGATAGLLIGMYLVSAASKLQPNLEWLAPISLFTYLKPGPVIDAGDPRLGDVAVFAVAAVICWAAALVAFRRRDLVA